MNLRATLRYCCRTHSRRHVSDVDVADVASGGTCDAGASAVAVAVADGGVAADGNVVGRIEVAVVDADGEVAVAANMLLGVGAWLAAAWQLRLQARPSNCCG